MTKMGGGASAAEVWAAATRTLTDILGTNYSSARAGYIDELAAANVPADVDTLKARALRGVCILDFWSANQEELPITGTAADQALPDVVVAGIPTGATLLRVVAMFKFRAVDNTYAGVNKLKNAQFIQVRDDTPGTWVNAIPFVDDQFSLAASTREGGDVIISGTDIKATVVGNDTYNFQWDECLADQGNIQFNDIQVGLRVFFTL